MRDVQVVVDNVLLLELVSEAVKSGRITLEQFAEVAEVMAHLLDCKAIAEGGSKGPVH